MNNQLTMVSIICTSYNHEPFIQQCLDGFLMQKCDFNFEVIIHDDASTDNTANIIRQYVANYPNIFKPILQTTNQASQERGRVTKIVFGAAKGKYIAYCEGDDYWTDPLKLQKQVDFLENNPEYSLCFTNTSIIDQNNNLVEKQSIKQGAYSKSEFIHEEMPIFAPTLTRVFKNVFLENEYNIPFGDTVQLVYLSRFGKIKYFDEITSAYRKHQGGVWSLKSELNKKIMFINSRIDCLEVVNEVTYVKIYKSIIIQFWNLKKIIRKEHSETYNNLFQKFSQKKTPNNFKLNISICIVKYLNSNSNFTHNFFKKLIQKLLKNT